MKTIAVLSQKGGTGKTTIALHLAVASERAGKSCAVVDKDYNTSKTCWGE